MSIQARPDSFELGDYLGVLRRRGWIAIVLALLGALGAAAYVHEATKTYMATTSVYVSVNAANATNIVASRTGLNEVNMDNEAAIVDSTSVASVAARTLHSSTPPDQLVKQVTVTVPPNTNILQISCSSTSPAKAAACAQAFANAYLSTRQGDAQSKINAEIGQERAKLNPEVKQAVALKYKITRLPPSAAQLPGLRATLKEVKTEIGSQTRSISALNASNGISAGYIITPAVPPTSPSNPRLLLYGPSGLFAGLLIGLLAAFVLDRRDDRIHSPRDVARYFELPVLFSLPGRKMAPQASVAAPRSVAGREFIDLAQAVAAGLGEGSHVLVVAGTSPGPAGSLVAANLAATLARTRSDVILVCTDLGDTVTPQLLGMDDGRGLAEILASTATVAEVARRPADFPRLRIIPPGIDTAGAVGYLRHDAIRRLVADMQRHARYVVIAAQATGDGTETFGFAEFADAAILVAQDGTTTKAEIAEGITRLDRLRTPILGAAVLPAPSRKSGLVSPVARTQQRPRPGPAQEPQDLRRRHAPPAGQAARPLADQQRRGLPHPPMPGETLPMPRVTVSAGEPGQRHGDELPDEAAGGS